MLVRNMLSEKIFGSIIHLKNIGVIKYGNILENNYLGNEHINQWLIYSKYVLSYHGGRKTEWDYTREIN